jgi:hypothetical protein
MDEKGPSRIARFIVDGQEAAVRVKERERKVRAICPRETRVYYRVFSTRLKV